MFGSHFKKAGIQSEIHTLKFLKAHLDPSHRAMNCNNMLQLHSLLLSKNRKGRHTHKHPFMNRQGERRIKTGDQWVSYKVQEQMERIKQDMELKSQGYGYSQQEEPSGTKIKETRTQSQVQIEGEGNIYEHLKAIGWKEAQHLAYQLTLSHYNEQNMQTLLECLSHMLDPNKEIDLSFQNELIPSRPILHFRQYVKLFEVINQHKNQQKISILELLSSKKSSLSYLKAFSNEYFNIILQHFKRTLIRDDSQLYFINELATFKTFLLKKAEIEGKKIEGVMTSPNYWKKLAYLLRCSQKYYNLIEIHLRDHQHLQLLQFMRSTLEGRAFNYSKDIYLLNSDPYYRQFVLILERNCLQLIKEQRQIYPREQIIYIAFKQIELKIIFKQNYDQQNQFLRNYSKQEFLILQQELVTMIDLKKIHYLIEELLVLGRYSEVVQMLLKYEKIDYIQALLLLAILGDINLQASTLLLYEASQTNTFCMRLMKQIIMSASLNQCRECSELMQIFLPKMSIHFNNYVNSLSQLLCLNLELFRYIASTYPFWDFCKQIGLSIESMPLLLENLLSQHACYLYSAQLVISMFIPVSEYYSLCPAKINAGLTAAKIRHARTASYSKKKLAGALDPNFLVPCLQIEDCDPQLKCQILIKSIIVVIKYVSQLSWDYERRNKHYDQVIEACEMLISLRKKQFRETMLARIRPLQAKAEEAFTRLPEYLTLLSFCASIITLKVSIQNSSYQTMVNVFNLYIEQYSQKDQRIKHLFAQVLNENESVRLSNIFEELMIQSVLVIKQFKPRVIVQNRFLFKVLCRQLEAQLRTSKHSKNSSGRSEGLNRTVQEELANLMQDISNI